MTFNIINIFLAFSFVSCSHGNTNYHSAVKNDIVIVKDSMTTSLDSGFVKKYIGSINNKKAMLFLNKNQQSEIKIVGFYYLLEDFYPHIIEGFKNIKDIENIDDEKRSEFDYSCYENIGEYSKSEFHFSLKQESLIGVFKNSSEDVSEKKIDMVLSNKNHINFY